MHLHGQAKDARLPLVTADGMLFCLCPGWKGLLGRPVFQIDRSTFLNIYSPTGPNKTQTPTRTAETGRSTLQAGNNLRIQTTEGGDRPQVPQGLVIRGDQTGTPMLHMLSLQHRTHGTMSRRILPVCVPAALVNKT